MLVDASSNGFSASAVTFASRLPRFRCAQYGGALFNKYAPYYQRCSDAPILAEAASELRLTIARTMCDAIEAEMLTEKAAIHTDSSDLQENLNKKMRDDHEVSERATKKIKTLRDTSNAIHRNQMPQMPGAPSVVAPDATAVMAQLLGTLVALPGFNAGALLATLQGLAPPAVANAHVPVVATPLANAQGPRVADVTDVSDAAGVDTPQ